MTPRHHFRRALFAVVLVLPLLAAAQSQAKKVVSTDVIAAVAVLDHQPTAGDLSLLPAGVVGVPFTELPMIAVQGTSTQLDLVKRLPGFNAVWPNRAIPFALHESVPLIGADHVWSDPDLGFDGSGVGVAVIDSGIDGTHPDVHWPEHTKQNVKLLGYQKVFQDLTFSVPDVQNTDLNNGHGTHVAGIVAGTGAASATPGYYKGVAPGADLIGLGAADGVDLMTGVAAYDWVLHNRTTYNIKVINNSWADGSIAYDPNDPLNIASKAAHDAGITVVFAAGNDGQAGDVFNRYAFPDWVVSAGGGDKNGNVWTGSSRGTDAHHASVVAPGYFIASALASTGAYTRANGSPADLTDPANPRLLTGSDLVYYTYLIGTSMAAPHLAGTVALMLDANPNLTPDQVKSIVVATAKPMPGCPVIDCGAGYLDAAAAVRAAITPPNAPPTATVSVPGSAKRNKSVTFDASASTDTDGTIVDYRFDFGDATATVSGAASSTVHKYLARGTYTWSVTVTDDDGATGVNSGSITVT